MNTQERELPTRTEPRPAPPMLPFQRYIPLVAWAFVILTLLFIPLKIIGYGFLPAGDARRHVAKAFTDKPNPEIMVLGPEYKVDHSPGWEGLLRFLHFKAGWGMEALVSFSVIGLMLCVFYAPLPWLRRPEAWLAALLAQLVAIPELMTRLTQARPLLLTEGILIALLFAWSKPATKNPSPLKIILTCLGFGLSAWVHGSWYLWVMPLAAFFLARCWSSAFWLTACWVFGTLAGAVLTGKPVAFLEQALVMASKISHEHVPKWLLVGELRPSYGEFGTLTLLAIVFLWRRQQGKIELALFRQPIFCLIVIGWILGFGADRCWADWGIPAVLVWLTIQFEEIMAASWDAASPKRLVACGLIAMPLLFHSTNDLDRRYSYSAGQVFLDANDPTLQGWLPETNGIFYSSEMGFFYDTFYKNPTADWRYILGLEPALMPSDDLETLRKIQMNPGAPKAYEPWVNKMRPADRLVIFSPVQPDLPRLEWHDALGNLWIGRLPRKEVPK
ncbi:MAG TPA: hypothetical protein VFC07_05115 [Verrucomicrobiae bacterium]|nr:hypothetical protein [Verrucomicrobiae bacterium]